MCPYWSVKSPVAFKVTSHCICRGGYRKSETLNSAQESGLAHLRTPSHGSGRDFAFRTYIHLGLLLNILQQREGITWSKDVSSRPLAPSWLLAEVLEMVF